VLSRAATQRVRFLYFSTLAALPAPALLSITGAFFMENLTELFNKIRYDCKSESALSATYEIENLLISAVEKTKELQDALRYMLAGCKYIRSTYGDLEGIGWDTLEEKAEKALGIKNSTAAASERS
jgi:hypothetical protein